MGLICHVSARILLSLLEVSSRQHLAAFLTSLQPLTVAIVGENDRSKHLAAIHQSPHLRVGALARSVAHDGNFTERIQGTPHSIVDDPRELLEQGTSDVLVVCTPPDERAYWIKAGLGTGRWVVSPLADPSPPEARSSTRWLIDVPLGWTAAEAQIQHRVQVTGRIRFVRGRMRVPVGWLTGEGVLVRWGAWLPVMLERTIGVIDQIRATTMNHRHPGAWEDHALALVSFANGTEGTIEIDALGEHADWQVELIGDDGPILCGGDLRAERVQGLARLYGQLGEHAAPASADAHRALFLARWIRQSGRLDTSLSRREARRG
jgi:hypothetical protein